MKYSLYKIISTLEYKHRNYKEHDFMTFLELLKIMNANQNNIIYGTIKNWKKLILIIHNFQLIINFK